jgi:CBS domain-containing protein
VIDGEDRVVGVVSKTDVLHRAVEGPQGSRPDSFLEFLADGLGRDTDLDPEALGTVEEFMSTEPVTASPDDSIRTIAQRMLDTGVHGAVVVDENQRVLGVATSFDLLRALLRDA